MIQRSQDIVRRLLRVISRQEKFSVARELLDDNLIAYMDDWRIACGQDAWFRWVRFLQMQADKSMSGLTVVIDEISEHDNVVTVQARWSAEVDGTTLFSNQATVIYVVQAGKITHIRTHRANYIFVYGRRIADS